MIDIPNYDLHNHTIHCGHANENATLKNLVQRGADLHLDYLGISEHVRFPEEIVSIHRIREDRYHDELPGNPPLLLLGGEIDPDPYTMDGKLVVDPAGLDFIILSMHRLPKSGIGVWLFHKQNYSPKEVEIIGEQWLEWLEACIEYSSFHILGHPVRFPIELGLYDIRQDRAFYRVYDILKKLANRKKAFEINSGFVQTLPQRGYFEVYADLVRDLKKAGVKFSRGSDSHNANDVGRWDQGRALANLAGLDETDWITPSVTFAEPF